MALYINTTVIEAYQWFKNGDHPDDHVGEQAIDWDKVGELRPDLLDNPFKDSEIPEEAYYTRLEGSVVRFYRLPPPGPKGTDIHDACKRTWHDHGWIDEGLHGYTVCPGDWVIMKPNGEHRAVKPAIFETTYSLIEIFGAQKNKNIIRSDTNG